MTDGNPDAKHATQVPDYSEWDPITDEEAHDKICKIETELLAVLLRSEWGKSKEPHELLADYYARAAEIHRIVVKARTHGEPI
jgi:hypothetical protein